jgi:hypothetical protein
MFRHLAEWASFAEAEGAYTIPDMDHWEWSLMDAKALYAASQRRLPADQANAIRLYLCKGFSEVEAARKMGLGNDERISRIADEGLKTLIYWYTEGGLLALAGVDRGAAEMSTQGGGSALSPSGPTCRPSTTKNVHRGPGNTSTSPPKA